MKTFNREQIMKDLVNGVRFKLNDTDLTKQQKLDVMKVEVKHERLQH